MPVPTFALNTKMKTKGFKLKHACKSPGSETQRSVPPAIAVKGATDDHEHFADQENRKTKTKSNYNS